MATRPSQRLTLLRDHVDALRECRACPSMIGPVVSGGAVLSDVMLLGQAPGTHEGPLGKPFAWTAGKTLFKWFGAIGLPEDTFRRKVYMAAVCRCFPGKGDKGGDRVPDEDEVARCRRHLASEIAILRPKLVVPVGKLAIAQLLPCKQLVDVVGVTQRVTFHGRAVDVMPLPHPSGASTWHRTEPGKGLLARALELIAAHPAMIALGAHPPDLAAATAVTAEMPAVSIDGAAPRGAAEEAS